MESFTHVLTHLLTKRTEFLVPSARSRFWSLYCPTACLDSRALPVSVYRVLRCLTLWPPLDPSSLPLGMSSYDFCVPGIGPPRLLALNTQKCALANIKNITEGCGEAVKKPQSVRNSGTVMREVYTAHQHMRIVHTRKSSKWSHPPAGWDSGGVPVSVTTLPLDAPSMLRICGVLCLLSCTPEDLWQYPCLSNQVVFKLSNPKYYHKLTAITYSLSSRSFLHVSPQPRIHSVLSCHLQGLAPRSPPSLIFCQVPQALSFPPNSFHYLEYVACWIWLTPDYLYFFSPAEF